MAKFRIGTYNIHKPRGLDGRTRVERVAGALSDLDTDIDALQEVVNHQGQAVEDTKPPTWRPSSDSTRLARPASIVAARTGT